MYYNDKLDKVINEIAEVAGYLWEKGWAERNGGNITVNITNEIDDTLRTKTPISDRIAIGEVLPNIKGMFFFCKGTNKRMRDLARHPLDNGSIIRICNDGAHYEIIADKPVKPTSELPAHLSMHNLMVERGTGYKAAIHTHPIDLVAMSHNPLFLEKDVLSKLLWSMIPETRAFCPKGIGIASYELPGSLTLAKSTIAQLNEYDVVMWEKHGVCAIGPDILDAFAQIDVLSKAAQFYLTALSMQFIPTGMSAAQLQQLKEVFKL